MVAIRFFTDENIYDVYGVIAVASRREGIDACSKTGGGSRRGNKG